MSDVSQIERGWSSKILSMPHVIHIEDSSMLEVCADDSEMKGLQIQGSIVRGSKNANRKKR